MNRFLLTITFFFLAFNSITAQESVETIFAEANNAYEQKNYQKAIKAYNEIILVQKTESASLFYNLGNSYYKSGMIGNAILNYEKSLLLDDNEDTRHNLEIAKDQQIVQLSSVGSTPRQWWENLVRTFSANTWAILTVLLFWGTIAGWIFWLLAKERSQRKRGFVLGILGIPLVLIAGLLASTRNDLEKDSRRAILLEKEIDLRISPDPKGKALSTLHEGVELNLLEEINDWYHVRLINGDQGWLPENSFERI